MSDPVKGPSGLARRIAIAKAAGAEVAELADEILSSDGDPKVYEDEIERLRINAASVILRAIERTAIPAETLDQAIEAMTLLLKHHDSDSWRSGCTGLCPSAYKADDAVKALRAAREGKP